MDQQYLRMTRSYNSYRFLNYSDIKRSVGIKTKPSGFVVAFNQHRVCMTLLCSRDDLEPETYEVQGDLRKKLRSEWRDEIQIHLSTRRFLMREDDKFLRRENLFAKSNDIK